MPAHTPTIPPCPRPKPNCVLAHRRHLTELLVDQLPVLRDLQRALDEAALGVDTAAADQHSRNILILEQVGGGNARRKE